jgi:hypothetical protein
MLGALTATAATASAPDIQNGGDPHEGIGQGDGNVLNAGVTYRVSHFPLALAVRAPDSHWYGAQYESGRFRFVQLNHVKTGNIAFHGAGYITLESATGATPSVASAVKRLHDTPMTAGPVKAVRIAGFSGQQFDATITANDLRGMTCPGGKKCSAQATLAPFLANRHCGFCGDAKFQPRETHDVKAALTGELFRFVVIDVRGKTVVIYLEPAYNPNKSKFTYAKTFPTFLPYAQKMLAALRVTG